MLSLAHLTFMHADPLALIGLARIGGFDAVGLRLVDPAPEAAFLPAVEDAGLRRRIRAELAATGIALLDVEAIWLWPQTDLDRLKPMLAAGAELGARNVLVAGNDPDRSRMSANFARLCGMAREFDLRVGFEFIPYTALSSLEVAQEILQEVAQPNAGLLVDVLHLSRSGGNAAQLAALPAEAVAYGHLCDAPAAVPETVALKRQEARGARLYPGDGGLDITAFLRALPPGKPIAMEAPATAYGDDDAERARRAGAACRRALAAAGGA